MMKDITSAMLSVQKVSNIYFIVFLLATAISVWQESMLAALLSLTFLITAIGLRLHAHLSKVRASAETLTVFVKPLGLALLMLTVYQTLSLAPAVFEWPVLEHPLPPDALEKTITLFLFGVSLFWVGFSLNFGEVLANALASQVRLENQVNHQAVIRVAKRGLLIGLILYVTTVVIAGYSSPLAALLDMNEFRRKALSLGVTSATAVLMFLCFAVPKAMLLMQLADKKQTFSSAEKRFWFFFVAIEIAVSFTFGIRGVFVSTMILLGVAWYYRRRQVSLGAVMLGGLAAVAVVTALGTLRDYLSLSEAEKNALETLQSKLDESSWMIIITTPLKRLDALQRFGEIIEGFSYNFSEEDLLWGKGIAGDLLLYVPRTLLPFEKPYTTAYYFMEMFYPSAVGIFSFELSLFGEAFLNFGVWGMMVSAVLSGVAIRTLNELFSEERLQTSDGIRFWYFWLFLLPFNLFNQGLFAAAMPLLLNVAAGGVALYLVQRFRALVPSQPLAS
jgi:hypothetical protein